MNPDRDKPMDDCDACRGTGKYNTRYNPNSKWDWWSFGGRWNGAITGNYEGSDDGFNFNVKYRTLANNMCDVKDIAEDFVPFAVITPDGEWHERGKMGWWAIVSNENSDWEQVAKDIFFKYPDYTAVLLDMHI